MSNIHELFFTLIDTLKENGIHVTAAASQLGVNPVTVRSWRHRHTGPKQEHITLLLKAFPNQLKKKAEELGILLPAELSKEERLEQLLADARQQVSTLEHELEQLQSQSEEEKQALQRRINTLLATLEKLTS